MWDPSVYLTEATPLTNYQRYRYYGQTNNQSSHALLADTRYRRAVPPRWHRNQLSVKTDDREVISDHGSLQIAVFRHRPRNYGGDDNPDMPDDLHAPAAQNELDPLNLPNTRSCDPALQS